MARTQQQAGGAMTVWMILFAAMWLVSTVFLVILYTGREDLKNAVTMCEDDRSRLVSSRERQAVALYKEARKGGPTVVGLLNDARRTALELSIGDPDADVGAIRTKLGDALNQIRTDDLVSRASSFSNLSYHESLTKLYGEFKTEQGLRLRAEEQLAAVEQEKDALAQASIEQRDAFDRQTREVAEQLSTVESERGKVVKEQADRVAALEQEYKQRRQQSETELTQERSTSERFRKQVVSLEQRVSVFQRRFAGILPGPAQMATAREPDGRILKAIPGDDVVFIDLGRGDNLSLGLRFAVYSAGRNIPVDGRAKAQIEVIAVFDRMAQCEIKRVSPGQVIMENDQIANPVYDPNRPTTFVVLGNFDLDHDGLVDADGAAVIRSMIREWKATVTTELTALTDFLVVGGAPRRPRPAKNQSTEELERFNAGKLAYDQYIQAVSMAQSLSIPVLNQELFLNFLGYTDRVARR